jgi:BolA family transcriptional regulator, general stress-responsive regulator
MKFMRGGSMSMQNQIEKKLQSDFNPTHLEVLNESANHNVPDGSESHFKVVVISDKFEGLPLLKCHRMINQALEKELTSIHALAIHVMTAEKWQKKQVAPESPPCLGGSAK